MDFYWPVTISADPYAVARADFQNFPFLYQLARLFSFFSPQVAVVIYLSIGLAAFSFIVYKEFRTRNKFFSLQFLAIAFLTYPFLFVFDRGNFELVVFFLLYLFISFYKKRPALSAVFLGLAIALKAFPVVMAGLFLADRRYRDIAISAVVSLAATFASYAFLPGGIGVNLPLHWRNLQLYTQTYAVGNEGVAFGNSLWGAFKVLSLSLGLPMPSALFYSVLVILFLSAVLLYVVFVEKSLWKRVALLVIALNLLPQVSGDYKLLHLLLPLILFVNAQETDGIRIDRLYLLLFGFLIIPKDYYHFPVLPEANLSVLLNPLLMFALTILIFVEGLKRFRRVRLSPGHFSES